MNSTNSTKEKTGPNKLYIALIIVAVIALISSTVSLVLISQMTGQRADGESEIIEKLVEEDNAVSSEEFLPDPEGSGETEEREPAELEFVSDPVIIEEEAEVETTIPVQALSVTTAAKETVGAGHSESLNDAIQKGKESSFTTLSNPELDLDFDLTGFSAFEQTSSWDSGSSDSSSSSSSSRTGSSSSSVGSTGSSTGSSGSTGRTSPSTSPSSGPGGSSWGSY